VVAPDATASAFLGAIEQHEWHQPIQPDDLEDVLVVRLHLTHFTSAYSKSDAAGVLAISSMFPLLSIFYYPPLYSRNAADRHFDWGQSPPLPNASENSSKISSARNTKNGRAVR